MHDCILLQTQLEREVRLKFGTFWPTIMAFLATRGATCMNDLRTVEPGEFLAAAREADIKTVGYCC